MVHFTIKSDNKDIPASSQVLSISVVNEVNRVSYAELVLVDGDYASQTYALSDGDFFDPGKKISIGLREENAVTKTSTETIVFKGIVVAQSLRHDQGSSLLTVEMSDVAIKMTTTKNTDVFEDIKDNELIEQLIRNSGISAGTIAETAYKHEQLVQYHTTNWDMMLTRADANGLLVTAVNGRVAVQAPDLGKKAAREFDLIKDLIYDLEFKLDVTDQYEAVQTRTWDEKEHTLVTNNTESIDLPQGKLKAAEAMGVMGAKDRLLAVLPLTDEATAWGKAAMQRKRLSMLRGSFKTSGGLGLNLMDTISIKGMGLKFQGNTMISGIRHEITAGEWFTHLQFGLSPQTLTESANLSNLPASGLLPAINGLQIAIVKDIELDPTDRVRVKVKMPGVTGGAKVVWARLTMPDAGNARGVFFWPEPGDEVILGFVNDDPRYPVILGSLYGSKNVPPFKRDEENTVKGFVSRSGLKMLFDDKKKQVSILTSDNNKIVIDQEAKFIEVNDVNGNKLKLGEEGVQITSAKDLTIKADGNISIEGKKVEIKGSSIELK